MASSAPAPDPAPSGRLQRTQRLQHQGEFRGAMRRGRRTASDHLVVSALLHDPTRTGGHRLGLAVAKTAGHAPARARLRRLLREAFRAVRHRWPRAADLVVLAKKPWPEATLWSVTAELAEAAERLRLN